LLSELALLLGGMAKDTAGARAFGAGGEEVSPASLAAAREEVEVCWTCSKSILYEMTEADV